MNAESKKRNRERANRLSSSLITCSYSKMTDTEGRKLQTLELGTPMLIEYRVRLRKPNPKQAALIRSEAKRKIICAGRRRPKIAHTSSGWADLKIAVVELGTQNTKRGKAHV